MTTTVVVSALIAVAPYSAAVADSVRVVPSSGTTVCEPETYQWLGNVVLAPGDSYGTGIVVPSRAGTELVLHGFSYSADPTETSFINVDVGGVVALEDAPVIGGQMTATNIGTVSLTLTTVGVAVSRCQLVDQAGPSGPAVIDFDVRLPETGKASRRVALAAAVLLIVGGLLTRLGARRERPGQ